MKTDRYTKAVLTIIALALVGLLLKPAPDLSMLSTATAQSYNTSYQAAVPLDVRIVSVNSTNLEALPVYIVPGPGSNNHPPLYSPMAPGSQR